MALINGEQYKESLRKQPNNFWYGGEKVEDATSHPATSRTTDTYAALYDLVADPANRDTLTIASTDVEGERDHFAWLLPRDRDDLVFYRNAARTFARATAGTYGRGQDVSGTFLTGIMAMADIFAPNNPEWQENAQRYFGEIRRDCKFLVHATIHPQWDRSRPIGDSPTLRVVEERKDGLVVSGVRTVCTAAPFSHETLVATLPARDLGREHSLLFSTPTNLEGIKVVTRRALDASNAKVDPRTHPIGVLGDELDAMVLYDNVLVPWDNVFSYGDPNVSFQFSALADWISYQIVVRLQVKAEILAGMAQLIADSIGTSDIQGVQDFIIECIRFAETLQAFIVACEEGWRDGGNGIAVPDGKYITLARMYGVENYRRIVGHLMDLSGQSLLLQPPPDALDGEAYDEVLDKVLSGSHTSQREKSRLFRAVWDFACDGFGGRQDLFEIFNGTNSVQLMHVFFMPRYDTAPLVRAARYATGIDFDEDATVAKRIAAAAAQGL